MPLQATSGAASYDAFGGGAAAVPTYIEDVFSTWLYAGNGSTQTINNGIDLAGKGGLTWIKSRTAATNHFLFDTNRGALNELNSNTTEAQTSLASSLTAFNSNGFSLGSAAGINVNEATYTSWTFREQPKFFDVVTFTTDGSANQRVPHNLGSVPGCVIVKTTAVTDNWYVYHTSSGRNNVLRLNLTAAQVGLTDAWGTSNPTSTDFGISNSLLPSGRACVAYIFAHNAGGFGLTGTDNVISCGSFTTDGSTNATIDLGYEPQWVMIKPVSDVGDWRITDSMRAFAVAPRQNVALTPNSSAAENQSGTVRPSSTGFTCFNIAFTTTFIYIAIRRGPMKVPTTGTSVFSPQAPLLPTTGTKVVTNFPVDLQINFGRSFADNRCFADRLRGLSTTTLETSLTRSLVSTNTDQEVSSSYTRNFNSAGYEISTDRSGSNYGYWNFRRAPGFFDQVCYTGTGSARTVAHNLAAVPELMIVKRRDSTGDWPVWNPAIFAIDSGYITLLNSTVSVSNSGTSFNSTAPTSTVFSVGTNANTNASGGTYVSYLFATCAGVSKVGSYTGTGTTQTINCGFTGGARFVLIKRIASAGGAPAGADWYVWDSARGIVAGNDPYLLLNSTAAEVTNTDFIDTAATGFEISSTAPAEINASGGTFIFLAIA